MDITFLDVTTLDVYFGLFHRIFCICIFYSSFTLIHMILAYYFDMYWSHHFLEIFENFIVPTIPYFNLKCFALIWFGSIYVYGHIIDQFKRNVIIYCAVHNKSCPCRLSFPRIKVHQTQIEKLQNVTKVWRRLNSIRMPWTVPNILCILVGWLWCQWRS